MAQSAEQRERFLIDPDKFRDPRLTADGEPRAWVRLRRLETLWFCTGTLCNLACENCYIESSPRNDALVYLGAAEVAAYLDEIRDQHLGTRLIGFTGGEPFMNPDLLPMLEDVLERGLEALVLTNAMRPMDKHRQRLLALGQRHGERLALRVSLDHYSQDVHEQVRGRRSWKPAMAGLRWLVDSGFPVSVAGRMLSGETEPEVREGFARLFRREGITLDARDPAALTLFPEMDARLDVPEITEACWGKLRMSPDSVMCSSSRMVVKRKGAEAPAVVACTLLPHDPRFELGRTLADAQRDVPLNHPHCARFCVLGGASCSGG